MMTSRWPLAVVFALTVACRSAAPAAPPQAPVSPAPAVAPRPAPSSLPLSIRWVRDSAEHRALFLQVYRAATSHVESVAAARAPGTWGVVLDADETVLDNSLYQVEQERLGRSFDPVTWTAWCARREAAPLPGAPAFLSRVRALGGKVVIVTNRTAAECPDTEAVFRAHGLVQDAMLCRPAGGPSDKNPRFEAVARGTTGKGLPPLEVVAFVGDNILDFPDASQALRGQGDELFAAFGTRFFVLPNPMYGSWEKN